MSRLTPKQEALCDAEHSYYTYRRGGQHVTNPTLTVGKARRICEAGKAATGLVGMSRVNKTMTLQQSHDILSGAGAGKPDDYPLNSMAAKNILREFGRYYKE